MMDVYFDFENAIEIHKKRVSSEVINDGMKAIKKHCTINFNFSKQAAFDDPAMQFVIKGFTEGLGAQNKINFCDQMVPERPVKSNFHQSLVNKQSLFFINGEIHNGQQAGSLIICNIGEEEELFRKLMFFHDEYKFSKDLPIGSADFDCWDKLHRFVLPFTDLIILDKFLFNNDLGTIASNYEKILNQLHLGKDIKTNIVIVTQPDKIHHSYDVVSKTKEVVENLIGKKPNVTLITYRSNPEHDRTIFTNYTRFKSGDSFNYFNSRNEKITAGRELDLKCLIDSEYFKLSASLISDLQTVVDDLQRINPGMILGDKKSNFLKFAE